MTAAELQMNKLANRRNRTGVTARQFVDMVLRLNPDWTYDQATGTFSYAYTDSFFARKRRNVADIAIVGYAIWFKYYGDLPPMVNKR